MKEKIRVLLIFIYKLHTKFQDPSSNGSWTSAKRYSRITDWLHCTALTAAHYHCERSSPFILLWIQVKCTKHNKSCALPLNLLKSMTLTSSSLRGAVIVQHKTSDKYLPTYKVSSWSLFIFKRYRLYKNVNPKLFNIKFLSLWPWPQDHSGGSR